jgi:hypothetical protein
MYLTVAFRSWSYFRQYSQGITTLVWRSGTPDHKVAGR